MRFGCSVIAAVVTLGWAVDAAAYCRGNTCTNDDNCTYGDDDGCPRGGVPLTWRSLPIPYSFSKQGSSKIDDDAMRSAVRRAFQTWADVTCDDGSPTSLSFVENADVPDKPLDATEAAKPFGIYFRDDTWPYNDGDESLAQTNQKFGEIRGGIEYADIEVNTAQNAFATGAHEDGIDLQSVITHEVGHYIGLAHSRVDDSIMVARYCQSNVRCDGSTKDVRALAADDVAAVCALYPPNGIAGVHFTEPKTGGCNVGGRGEPTIFAGFAFLGAALVRRRRRRP